MATVSPPESSLIQTPFPSRLYGSSSTPITSPAILNFRTRRQSPGGGLGNFPNPDVLLRWSSHLYGV